VRIALAQVAPVFLHREATIRKVVPRVREAADSGASLVAFGETLIPGYPRWLELTDGARFEDSAQKRLHARYLREAVCIEEGHLDPVRAAASETGCAVIVGVAERPRDRGGHSVYCSRVFIQPDGSIGSVHRKLMPTYEERLAWSIGDGAGLVTHRLGGFTIGALNCWENWMPLARAALYAAGEDLHVALWPGSRRNTEEITRFVAREGRSYVASVCGLLREQDIPDDVPERDRMIREAGPTLLEGGSCAAAPDASWIVEPVVGQEALLTIDLDHDRVLEERQSFDPAGHYARPDVLRLHVDRRRQQGAEFRDEDASRG
jgi:nitrilase